MLGEGSFPLLRAEESDAYASIHPDRHGHGQHHFGRWVGAILKTPGAISGMLGASWAILRDVVLTHMFVWSVDRLGPPWAITAELGACWGILSEVVRTHMLAVAGSVDHLKHNLHWIRLLCMLGGCRQTFGWK